MQMQSFTNNASFFATPANLHCLLQCLHLIKLLLQLQRVYGLVWLQKLLHPCIFTVFLQMLQIWQRSCNILQKNSIGSSLLQKFLLCFPHCICTCLHLIFSPFSSCLFGNAAVCLHWVTSKGFNNLDITSGLEHSRLQHSNAAT